MPDTRKIATKTLLGAGATVGGTVGFLFGETVLARRAIGTTEERPPSADGVYGDDLPGRPRRCLVLGDSATVGYGMTTADTTPPALFGLGLAHILGSPVDIRCVGVVGAQTSDLDEQITLGLEHQPEVAVIVIGTNDVTHRVRPSVSAAHLQAAVERLVDAGCEVVVGTCPDLGTVRPLMQPLRSVARVLSRHLAKLQTVAVVEAGGRAVSLADTLGPVFVEKHDIMFGEDRFHPSATGYANMVAVLVPSMAAALNEREHGTDHVAASAADTALRDVMPVAQAASEASQHAGTEVTRVGRWAGVLRRRR